MIKILSVHIKVSWVSCHHLLAGWLVVGRKLWIEQAQRLLKPSFCDSTMCVVRHFQLPAHTTRSLYLPVTNYFISESAYIQIVALWLYQPDLCFVHFCAEPSGGTFEVREWLWGKVVCQRWSDSANGWTWCVCSLPSCSDDWYWWLVSGEGSNQYELNTRPE